MKVRDEAWRQAELTALSGMLGGTTPGELVMGGILIGALLRPATAKALVEQFYETVPDPRGVNAARQIAAEVDAAGRRPD